MITPASGGLLTYYRNGSVGNDTGLSGVPSTHNFNFASLDFQLSNPNLLVPPQLAAIARTSSASMVAGESLINGYTLSGQAAVRTIKFNYYRPAVNGVRNGLGTIASSDTAIPSSGSAIKTTSSSTLPGSYALETIDIIPASGGILTYYRDGSVGNSTGLSGAPSTHSFNFASLDFELSNPALLMPPQLTAIARTSSASLVAGNSLTNSYTLSGQAAVRTIKFNYYLPPVDGLRIGLGTIAVSDTAIPYSGSATKATSSSTIPGSYTLETIDIIPASGGLLTYYRDGSVGNDTGLSGAPSTHSFNFASLDFALSNPSFPPPAITSHPANQTVVAGSSATFTVAASSTTPVSYQWRKDGVAIPGATSATLTLSSVKAADAGNYSVTVSNSTGAVLSTAATLALVPTTGPAPTMLKAGNAVTLTAIPPAAGSTVSYQWQFNGSNIDGATRSSLALANVEPANAGLYTVVVAGDAVAVSTPVIVGVTTTNKVTGTGTELLPANVSHPNGNLFDQVLLTGPAETITADPGQVTRTSFIDLNDDIIQMEFSGTGTLSLLLENASGPAAPVNYNQPTVSYMKGHAKIVITGADETTNLSVFTVGRATAVDPTGAYDILAAASAINLPANNGSSLFVGHANTTYDGAADIALIAISSTNGKFGSLRAANGSFLATKGMTGIYAPGVAFQGPVFIGDISASDAATPVIIIGSSPDTRITGGDLLQGNLQPVSVAGLTQLKFTAGSKSSGATLSAQTNKAVLRQNGVDVTAQIVVNPSQ